MRSSAFDAYVRMINVQIRRVIQAAIIYVQLPKLTSYQFEARSKEQCRYGKGIRKLLLELKAKEALCDKRCERE